jgi:PAS domain S-box-containing protein
MQDSDARYKDFIEKSTEGIWLFELEKPLSTKWPVKKQMQHAFTYAYLAECNDAMAKLFGYSRASEIIGARLSQLLIPTDTNNLAYLQTFIRSKYKMSNMETRELDRFGKLHIFSNNLVGIVNKGFMFRAWGTKRDITKHKQEEERHEFLAKLHKTLAVSIDHNLALQEIARLIVPYLADYCRIVIIDNNNTIKEIAVNHTDPRKVTLAEDLYDAYKDLPTSEYGVQSLLQNGKPELIETISDTFLQKYSPNKKTLKIVKEIGLKSYMGVPLIARRKIIGAITFSSIRDFRFYTKKDLQFVTEIAQRIALTLDNVRLFQEKQEELIQKEKIAQTLQAEKERLQIAQEASHIGVFERDIQNDTIRWTSQLERMYGLVPGTLTTFTNEQFLQMIHPEDRARVQREYKEQIKKSSPTTEFEYRIVRPDKSVRWIYSKSQIFYDKRGKPVRSVGINMDITERMQQQINLRFLADAGKILGSTLDYQATLNQIAKLAVPQIADWFGIEMLDEKGILQQIAVGHKDEAKITWAKDLREKYPPDMNDATGLPNVIRTGVSELYPYITDDMLVASAKDDKYLKLIRSIGMTSVMIVPLFAEGKTVGAITYVSSETKRQFTNADLVIAEELAQRISIAIENAKLYKSAQDAVMLRDDFISVASHELKTPITSVKIFTQVLQRHAAMNSDEKAHTSLTKMDKQIDKLTDLIYNMLNISKIQTGRLELNIKEFRFDDLVVEIVEILQQMTIKHKLVIVGKTNKMIYGDEDRIGQVLSNLISNAIKYSPGGDKIVITLTSKKNQLGVSVQDHGIGMAKQHLHKIFNRFYRVSGAIDQTFPGMGIGLYISSEIIARHGGKLWAESTPGKGSTFFMTLPLHIEAKEEIPTPLTRN